MAMKTMCTFGLLKILHYHTNNDTDFTADKGIMEILNQTYEAVATPQTFSGDSSMTSHDLVGTIGGQRPKPPPRNVIARL